MDGLQDKVARGAGYDELPFVPISPVLLMRFIDVRRGNAVFVSAFGALPYILMVIESRLDV